MTTRTTPTLQVDGLTKHYGSVRVLDDVSFAVERGSIVALLGPNGAGKTTTLNCVLGVTGFEGTVEVDGIPVRSRGKDARRRIGYLPQAPALDEGDTCYDALAFLADLKGADRTSIPSLLDLVHLKKQRDARVGHLSGGMRQRLALAAALLSDPPLLLLDEPTASLDVENRREFYDLVVRLREEGRTIVVSTHLFDRLSDLADRVIVLHGGRVAFDGALSALAALARQRRYVVHLNGWSPETLVAALQRAGIDPERVQPADIDWEDVLVTSLASREEADPCAR